MLVLAMVFNSCSEDKDLNDESNSVKLNFDTYERLKGQLLNINTLSKPKNNSRLEQNNIILNQVNDFYGTDIDFDDSLKELKSTEEIFNWLKMNSDFNQTDINILTSFSSNLTSISFDDATSILEEDISNENLDSSKIEKYHSIVNSVKLIEYQYPGFFTIESTQKSWGCAWAVAKLALASAALVVGCSPPAAGASVGTSCYLAATGFVVASASVGMACGDSGDSGSNSGSN